MKENTLYVERFRPTELKHYVGNENVKDIIQKYLDQGDIVEPYIELSGSHTVLAGSGGAHTRFCGQLLS